MSISDAALLGWQQRQLRSVGLPELNRELYAYTAEHPNEAAIATDYQAMRWLPELGPRSVECSCSGLPSFRAIFDRADVRYALVRTAGAADEVRALLQGQNIAQLVFESQGFASMKSDPGNKGRWQPCRSLPFL